jgi:sporulation protein YlmC with PRC-barrel domain
MADEYLSWSELGGRPVLIAGQGRQAGSVEDFYFDPGTQAISALRISTGLHGYRILLPSAIRSLGHAGVTIDNPEKLIDEANAGPIYQLPTGNRLRGCRILTERGEQLGRVRDLVLGVYPPVALRISSFELEERRARRISAHEIVAFGADSLTVLNQIREALH